MSLTGITIFGIDIMYLVLLLGVLLALSIILNVISLSKIGKMNERYDKFFSGEDGKSLEDEINQKMEYLDKIKDRNEELAKKIDFHSGKLSNTYSKMEIYKYDAFRNMAGEVSFVLVLLNYSNSGILLNAMTGSNGSYFYAKEIQNGKAKVELSEEEKITLDKCVNE